MNDDGSHELFSALNSAIKKGAHMMPDGETVKEPPNIKRAALATINPNKTFVKSKHHFFNKDSIWQTEDSVTTQRPSSQPLAFEIFQDSNAEEICPQPHKEKRLPLYLRKLYSDQVVDCKENEYWGAHEVDMVIEDKEETETKWTAPFWSSIHTYLREREIQLPYDPLGIKSQKEITESMRTILMDWLVEVGDEYKLSEEAVHLAVAHADRYLQKDYVSRSELQLLGTSALFIACKQCEVYPPELKDFVYITNETYTKRQVLKMEQRILRTLQFVILFPTASTFLDMYVNVVESTMSSMTIHLSRYVCDAALMSLDVLEFLPSQIGAACLAIARKLMIIVEENQHGEVWPQLLAERSGYLMSDLREAALAVYIKFVHVCQAKDESAVYKKYLNKKYEEVARIRVPRHLEL